ncbi:predicted HD superfamily hydrolase [Agrilactobacillus composti DSM 18527 = JCM 14202]|nr:predicted HD superfamily hydrolase [Agrilactobacillus composti DSM 18527 = JCM 14202]
MTLKSHDQYRQHPTTSVNHFYEKLLNLEKTMNTTAGKRLARARTQYMQDFLAEFHAEWAGLR